MTIIGSVLIAIGALFAVWSGIVAWKEKDKTAAISTGISVVALSLLPLSLVPAVPEPYGLIALLIALALALVSLAVLHWGRVREWTEAY